MKHLERGDFSLDQRLIRLSILGLLIGAVSAGVALALLNLIRLFTNLFFFGDLSIADRSPSAHHLGAWVILIPLLGSLLIGLMARYGSEKIRGHGIPEALEAILFGKSLMQPKVAILKPLSSAISIGSGGPFGAEGPIIMTGGAFGSLFSQIFHLTSAERKTLLVAGAAAGMSAVFATPISAVLLSVELLLFEWKPRSLVPVALASVAAAVIRPFLLGSGPLFPIQVHAPSGPLTLISAAGVGILAGAFSLLVSSSLYRLEDGFAKLPIHWMWWPAIGGLVVGLGGYFQPRVLGVGYDVIRDLIENKLTLLSVIALVGVKALVWVTSLASGTSGGVLAPLLIMGAALGSIEAAFLPAASGPASLWAIVSMAAVLGGMMRSPFMACLFALELTQDISILPSLFIAAIVAYAFTVMYMKRSILTEKVARRGYDLFREYGVDPLERVRVGEAMTQSPEVVIDESECRIVATEFFGGTRRHRGYPVLDRSGKLCGVVTARDLLAAVSAVKPGPQFIRDLLKQRPIVAYPDESCRIAAERMAENAIGRLPVMSRGADGKLVGVLTRSDLLKARLRHAEEENLRTQPIRLPGFLQGLL